MKSPTVPPVTEDVGTGLRVLLSVPWTSPFLSDSRSPAVVEVVPRAFDLGRGRMHKAATVLRDAVVVLLRSRRHDATVVCTSMAEAIAVALLMRLRPGHPLVLWDFLLPRHALVRRVARVLLARVDLWLVIRRGDAVTFEAEFGARRTAFVPFPTQPGAAPDTAEEQYIYAAGTAHRDWATLVAAMRSVPGRVVISAHAEVDVPADLRDRVDVRPILSPDEGRAMLARAVVVCVPFEDTVMPSGPLIVLDALQAGKALVVSDVNGSRDYVDHGVDALVVPPGDPDSLAEALTRALLDAGLRKRLGAAAFHRAAALRVENVTRMMVDEVNGALAGPRRVRGVT